MLAPDQLNQIDQHLRKENWLLNEELIAELTDHYAAGIDERMAHGLSFIDALRAVHTDFGGRKALLQMEEETQKQQAIRYRRYEWQLIRSFTQGSRWYVSICLCAAMFLLSFYAEQYEMFVSANLRGFFVVQSLVVGHILEYIFFYAKARHNTNFLSCHHTAPVFILIYLFCFLTLAIEQYGASFWGYPFSDTKAIVLTTILSTLCLVYYIAVFIRFSQAVTHKRRLPA